jgi:hypothetical protein
MLCAFDRSTILTDSAGCLFQTVLQIKLGASRVLPLIRFRGAVRPVIIAGDRSYVERCIREGEQSKDQLRQRGVSGKTAGCRRVCTLV